MDYTVVILGGIPGSGKSYTANIIREHFEKTLAPEGKTITTVSADHFFEDKDGNYNFKPKLLGRAHAQCMSRFKDAIKEQVDMIIVDNTNTQKWEWEKYASLAKEAGYEVKMSRIPCTSEEEFQVFCERQTHGVPEAHLRKMWERWGEDDG